MPDDDATAFVLRLGRAFHALGYSSHRIEELPVILECSKRNAGTGIDIGRHDRQRRRKKGAGDAPDGTPEGQRQQHHGAAALSILQRIFRRAAGPIGAGGVNLCGNKAIQPLALLDFA